MVALSGLLVPFIAAAALSSLFQGCESAESYAAETNVKADENNDSNNDSNNGNNNGNDSGNGGGGNNGNDPGNGGGGGDTTKPSATTPSLTWDTSVQVYKLTITPQISTITQNGNVTVALTVGNPTPGLTYEWIAKDSALGKIAKDQQVAGGTRAIYTGTVFTGARQEIRVVEFQNGNKTASYGWAQVTQKAQ